MKSSREIKKDYQMFIDIQISKFFKLTNQTAFKNKQEANDVLNNIISAYNDKIATDHLRLDNLKDDAKATWFNNVEVNFYGTELTNVDSKDLTSPYDSIYDIDNEINDEDEETFEEMEEFFEEFDEQFYFLPEGSLPIIMYGLPLFEAYGYPFERYKDIISCIEEPKEFEKDLFTWEFDTTLSIIDSILLKNKEERELAYEEAIDIAEEYLDVDEAEKVIKEITNFLKKEMLQVKRNIKSNIKKGSKKRKK